MAVPALDARNVLPTQVTYFLCVSLIVLAPMFFGALYMSARESASGRVSDVLARMRVRGIGGGDWVWTVGSFVVLSAASFLLAKDVMPRLGLDATPFFFRNIPLAQGHRWILAVWPVFFFFNVFGEEFLWRGYIQPRHELFTGRWTWLVHGLCWAFWHLPMGVAVIFAALPIFFILPAVVQLRRNTTIAIVVHAAFGVFGFLALALGAVH